MLFVEKLCSVTKCLKTKSSGNFTSDYIYVLHLFQLKICFVFFL